MRNKEHQSIVQQFSVLLLFSPACLNYTTDIGLLFPILHDNNETSALMLKDYVTLCLRFSNMFVCGDQIYFEEESSVIAATGGMNFTISR